MGNVSKLISVFIHGYEALLSLMVYGYYQDIKIIDDTIYFSKICLY